MMQGINIYDMSKYHRTHKKQFVIEASIPPVGTGVHNRFEMSSYVTSDEYRVVMTGVLGEQWVTFIDKLVNSYTFADGSPITREILNSKIVYGKRAGIHHKCILPFRIKHKVGIVRWAMHVPVRHKIQVQTAGGTVLTANDPSIPHGYGDYIICADLNGLPNFNDMWVVNGLVFQTTYDMRAFSNLIDNRTELEFRQRVVHPEFDGIKIIKDDIVKQENNRDIHKYRELSHNICRQMRINYPGYFVKPKLSMDKKKIFIAIAKDSPFEKTMGLVLEIRKSNASVAKFCVGTCLDSKLNRENQFSLDGTEDHEIWSYVGAEIHRLVNYKLSITK